MNNIGAAKILDRISEVEFNKDNRPCNEVVNFFSNFVKITGLIKQYITLCRTNINKLLRQRHSYSHVYGEDFTKSTFILKKTMSQIKLPTTSITKKLNFWKLSIETGSKDEEFDVAFSLIKNITETAFQLISHLSRALHSYNKLYLDLKDLNLAFMIKAIKIPRQCLDRDVRVLRFEFNFDEQIRRIKDAALLIFNLKTREG
ncbi:MAG: hypothetical protein S4CHLAM20_08870 [Chlamydiia bacterium]|nr:hypothetical protein [Chlamydiia bacterium]